MTIITLHTDRPTCVHCGRNIVRVVGGPWFHQGDHRFPCFAGDTMAEPTYQLRWTRGRYWRGPWR